MSKSYLNDARFCDVESDIEFVSAHFFVEYVRFANLCSKRTVFVSDEDYEHSFLYFPFANVERHIVKSGLFPLRIDLSCGHGVLQGKIVGIVVYSKLNVSLIRNQIKLARRIIFYRYAVYNEFTEFEVVRIVRIVTIGIFLRIIKFVVEFAG